MASQNLKFRKEYCGFQDLDYLIVITPALSLCLLVLSADALTFANNLDPDQAQQNVGPDLGLYNVVLHKTDGIPESFFFRKVNLETKPTDNK